MEPYYIPPPATHVLHLLPSQHQSDPQRSSPNRYSDQALYGPNDGQESHYQHQQHRQVLVASSIDHLPTAQCLDSEQQQQQLPALHTTYPFQNPSITDEVAYVYADVQDYSAQIQEPSIQHQEGTERPSETVLDSEGKKPLLACGFCRFCMFFTLDLALGPKLLCLRTFSFR